MIYILCDNESSRVRYTFDTLFGRLLRTDHKLIKDPNEIPAEKKHPVINYSGKELPNSFRIPIAGLLNDSFVRNIVPRFTSDDLPRPFHIENLSVKNPNDYDLDYDIFSACFYLLTGYEMYVLNHHDEHGRYDEKRSVIAKKGFLSKPLVDIYLEEFWNDLSSRFPKLTREPHSFDYEITIDIDYPWAFHHKSKWKNAGGLIKDLFRNDMESFKYRLNAFGGNKPDPYDTFSFITNNFPVEKTRFFFLINNETKNDNTFNWKNKPFQNLIQNIDQKGYPVGLHPSYNTYMDREKILFEKEKLEMITGHPVNISRQHFLKFRLPQTFEYLAEAGITDEYTGCPVKNAGFKFFTTHPFTWFNLAKNRQENLTLHPTMVMDRALQKYLDLSPEAALTLMKDTLKTTSCYNGKFTLLIHNETLSEFREWKGWSAIIMDFLALLEDTKNKGCTQKS